MKGIILLLLCLIMTTAQAIFCHVNEHVDLEYIAETGWCKECAPGTTNLAGDDDRIGVNTECDITYCLVGQNVMNHTCTTCAGGTTNAAGDDASGGDTYCIATPCSHSDGLIACDAQQLEEIKQYYNNHQLNEC